jgi:pimeloyl-ACP methyl ester carboxylesterase
MEWYFILLLTVGAVGLFILLLLILISSVVAHMIIRPHRYSRSEQTAYNKKMGYDQGVEVLKREALVFQMEDGYVIHGDCNIIPGSEKFCLLAHGHATSREGALRYSLLFEELGFSTIIFDERSHGDNIHKKVTMGYQEGKDISQIVKQIYAKFGSDIYLGLQGVSMGASSVLLSAQYGTDVRFIVSDCAYARLKDVIRDMIERYHLPSKVILPFVGLFLKAFGHFSFSDAEPLKAVRNLHIPVLFIHGEKDAFVNVKNAYALYEAAPGFKKLVVFPEAKHAESITVDRAKYKETVREFLKEAEEKEHGNHQIVS